MNGWNTTRPQKQSAPAKESSRDKVRQPFEADPSLLLRGTWGTQCRPKTLSPNNS